MNELVNLIKEYVAQAHENYAKVQKRIMDKAATANHDLSPTIDRFGRMHAPCDGYEWDDRIFPGGAYLPFPMEFWEMLSEQAGRPIGPGSYEGKGARKHRIKVTVVEANELEVALKDFAVVGKGKTWDDGVSCYVYIETSRSGLSELVDTYHQEQLAIRKAKEDAEKAARHALKGEAPEGRVSVKGKVLAVKVQEQEQFSYYSPTHVWKMLVELENKSTVWGTIPSSIEELGSGDEVEFTATFTRAADDNTHAFFKRPSKAKRTAEAA
jgi:hypothetical protein